jgi:hypothetical protein
MVANGFGRLKSARSLILFLVPFSQPYPWAPTILVDERNAG